MTAPSRRSALVGSLVVQCPLGMVAGGVVPWGVVEVAAGFATHSGWAVGVVVGVVDGRLQVCDRRRVELISPELPRQAYHAAVDLPAEQARRLVAAVDASIAECSAQALAVLREAASDAVVAAVGVVGAPRTIPDVAEVLASHALMHASEGEQYRSALSAAAAELGLPVRRVDARQLAADVAHLPGWTASRLDDEHRRLRAVLGAPWQKDHKQAAEVALLALHPNQEAPGATGATA
jgi:hypothetical protein